MVFPYVTREQLERRLELDADALAVSDEEWLAILDEVLEAESERVELAEYAGVSYRDVDTTDEVPSIVREGVIRLARSAVQQIRTDGLSSENVGDGASYAYRPVSDIRDEVARSLSEADLNRSGEDRTRVTLL